MLNESKTSKIPRHQVTIEPEDSITGVLNGKNQTHIQSTSLRALDDHDPQRAKEYAFGQLSYAEDKKSKRNKTLYIELKAIDAQDSKCELKREQRRKLLHRLIDYGVIEGGTPVEQLIGLIGRERAQIEKVGAKRKLKENEVAYKNALYILQRRLYQLKELEHQIISSEDVEKGQKIVQLTNLISEEVFTALSKFQSFKTSEKLFKSICQIHGNGIIEYPTLTQAAELPIERLRADDAIVLSTAVLKNPLEEINALIKGYRKNIVRTSDDLKVISDLRKERINSGLDLIGDPKKNPNAAPGQESIEHKIGRIFFVQKKRWWPYNTNSQYIEIDADDGLIKGKSTERIRFLVSLKKYGIIKGNTLVSSVNGLVGEYLRDLYIREGVTTLSALSEKKQILAVTLQDELTKLENLERTILPNDFESREALRTTLLNMLDEYALKNDLLTTHMGNTGGKFNVTLFEARNLASRHQFGTHQPTLHDQGIFYRDTDTSKPIILSTEDHKVTTSALQGFIRAYNTDTRSEAAKVSNPISRWWYQFNDAIGLPLPRAVTKSAFAEGFRNEAELIDKTFGKHSDGIPKTLLKNTTLLIGFPFLYTIESLRGVYQDLKSEYKSFTEANTEKEEIGLVELIKQTKPDQGRPLNYVDVGDINEVHSISQRQIQSQRLIADHKNPNVFQRTDFISNTLRPIEASFNAIQTGFITNPVISTSLAAVGALSVTGILIPYQISQLINLINKGNAPKILKEINTHFKLIKKEGLIGKVISGIDEAKLAFLFSSVFKRLGPYDAVGYWENVAVDPFQLVDQAINIAYMHACAQQRQGRAHIALIEKLDKVSERKLQLDTTRELAPDTTTLRSIIGFALEFVVTPVRFFSAIVLSIKNRSFGPLRKEINRFGRIILQTVHGLCDLVIESLRFVWTFTSNAIRFAISAALKIPAVLIGTVGYLFTKIGNLFDSIHLKPIGFIFRGLGNVLTQVAKGFQYSRNKVIHFFDKYINNPVKQHILNRATNALLKAFNPLHPNNVLNEKIKLIKLTKEAYIESAHMKATAIHQHCKDTAKPGRADSMDPVFDQLIEDNGYTIDIHRKEYNLKARKLDVNTIKHDAQKLININQVLKSLMKEQRNLFLTIKTSTGDKRMQALSAMKSLESKSNTLKDLAYLIQYNLKIKDLDNINIDLIAMLEPKSYDTKTKHTPLLDMDSSPHMVTISCLSGDISKLLYDAQAMVKHARTETLLDEAARTGDVENEGYAGLQPTHKITLNLESAASFSPTIDPDIEHDYSKLPPLRPKDPKGQL